MIETFTALLFAHTLADFVLQTKWTVENKRKPGAFLLHAVVVLITLQLSVGQWDAPELLALTAAHMVIDALKTYGRFDSLAAFLLDQGAHVITLTFAAAWAPDLWQAGLWQGFPWAPALLAMLTGALLATRAGGFAVALLMHPYGQAPLPEGLVNGGRLIGLLERGLIFLFVLVGHPAGVGFLIAAKSVLRFDTTSQDQKAGEYVIIGTLASFGWALVAAYGTTYLLSLLSPLEIAPAPP